MSIVFLTPWAALFGLTALVPLAAFARLELRARRVRRTLSEPEPGWRLRAPVALLLVAVPLLLGLAAAQPVVERSSTRLERRDAEVYIVLDTSRSMLASSSPRSPTRLQRAIAEAAALRARLPDVRVGLASLTDRTLPHLFPTGDEALYRATLAQSLGFDRPPPSIPYERATSFASLSNLATGGFFTAPRRVAVVFTDGETQLVPSALGTTLGRASVELVFVHVGGPRERLYIAGAPELAYRADPAAAAALARAAALTGGQVLVEGDVRTLVASVTALLGQGQAARVARERERRQVPLTWWIVLAGALPLSVLVWRRNVPSELVRGRAHG